MTSPRDTPTSKPQVSESEQFRLKTPTLAPSGSWADQPLLNSGHNLVFFGTLKTVHRLFKLILIVVRFSRNGQKKKTTCEWWMSRWRTLVPNDIITTRQQSSLFYSWAFFKNLTLRVVGGWAADLVTPAGQKLSKKEEEPLQHARTHTTGWRKKWPPRANQVREWGCDVTIRKLCPLHI